MGRWTDDRAVSEVVGFILVFGMVVASFTVYQGVVVPDQNRQAEFQHSQVVQGQLQDLRNAILGTAATGTDRAVSVTLGATYPDRTVAKNLGVSGGAVETRSVGDGQIVLSNARAVGNGETADYLNGTNRSFTTEAVVYAPVNSFYADAPTTTYENSVLYNRFDAANVTLTDQSFIDGRRITLLALNGSLSATRAGTVTVSTTPISTSSTWVSVRNNSSDPMSITIPTTLDAATWRELAADQYDPDGNDPNAYVSAIVDDGPDRVTFVLEPGTTYDLRMARIGVGTDTDHTTARYLTTVSGNDSTVVAGANTTLAMEVRDAYNNPVSGVLVNASDGSGSKRTDANGRVSFRYHAPADAPTGSAWANYSFGETADPARAVNFTLNVMNVSGTGGTGGGAPTPDLVYNNDARADGPYYSDHSGVRFSVDDEAGQQLTINEITIDTANNIQTLSDGSYGTGMYQSELYVAADTDGITDHDGGFSIPNGGLTIDIGSDGYDPSVEQEPVLSAGSSATFYLYQFRTNTGAADMRGQTVDVTLTYTLADGSTGSTSFTMTVS